MILMIDNHDSFTYNLVQYFRLLGQVVDVIGVDDLNLDNLQMEKYTHLCVSPGPGHPEERQSCIELVRQYSDKIPILGVCLGHQIMAHAYGAKVITANKIMHGKTSKITHQGKGLFQHLPSPIEVARYHSLVVDTESLGNTPFECVAWTAEEDEKGVIMAMQHKTLPLYGIQFHPESIATEHGLNLIEHFIKQ